MSGVPERSGADLGDLVARLITRQLDEGHGLRQTSVPPPVTAAEYSRRYNAVMDELARRNLPISGGYD